MIARMVPIKHSSIFKSRWLALVWAAGILWFAYDFAAPVDAPANAGDNVEITDATGAPVSPEDAKKLQEAVEAL